MQHAREVTCALDRLYMAALHSNDIELLVRANNELFSTLDATEKMIDANGLVGEGDLQLADGALVPILHHCHQVCGLPVGPYPILQKYLERCRSAAAWKAAAASLQEVGKIADSEQNVESATSGEKKFIPQVLSTVRGITLNDPSSTAWAHQPGSKEERLLRAQRPQGKMGPQASVNMVDWTSQYNKRQLKAKLMR